MNDTEVCLCIYKILLLNGTKHDEADKFILKVAERSDQCSCPQIAVGGLGSLKKSEAPHFSWLERISDFFLVCFLNDKHALLHGMKHITIQNIYVTVK